MIKALIFDWGDTVMRDFPDKAGPMAYWDKVELISGAEVALSRLSNDYLCCIATNAGASDTDLMIKALKRVGADKYYRYFFSSKELGFNKPDVNFFIKITERISVNPENCVMIGNDYNKDISGAKASGMKTIFFNENRIKGNFIDADIIIGSMKELCEAIDKFK